MWRRWLCKVVGHRGQWVMLSDVQATSMLSVYRCRRCGVMLPSTSVHYDWSALEGEYQNWQDGRLKGGSTDDRASS